MTGATIITNIKSDGSCTANIVTSNTVTANVICGGAGPQGEKGDQGIQGIQGIPGDPTTVNAGNNIDIDVISNSEITVNTVDDPSFSGIHFDTVTPITIANAGDIAWNSVDGTLDIKLLNDVNLQTGQELHFYGKASGAIANGNLCQFAGVQGDHILMKKVVASEVKANHDLLIGVATTNIANNQFGYVTWFGKVNNVYTTGWAAGDLLYMDNSTGQLTKTAPVPPEHKITVAVVIKEATGASENGTILVRPTHSYQIGELEDTKLTSLSNGQVLKYNSTSGNWENVTLAISDTNGLQTALNAKEDLTNKSTSTSLGVSNTLYPSQNAVKVYVDNLLGNENALVYKGTLDCSTNPNYPAASAGYLYVVSVAGKIGGASGTVVDVGDMIICNTDNTVTGTQAAVGQYWNIIEKNIVGAVTGPASSVDSNVAFFDGVTGKVIKDSGLTLSGSNTGDNATNTQYSGLDAAKVNKAGDTMTGDLNMGTNELIGGTGVTDVLKLQGTTGNGTAASAAIQLLTGNNGGTTALTVLNNGNVGIGTTSPSAKLQVDTGAAATVGQIIKGASAQTADLLQIQNSAGVVLTRITSTGKISSTVDASINDLTVGRGAGGQADNTTFGNSALTVNVTGASNTAIGYQSLSVNTASHNTSVGSYSLAQNTTGSANAALGYTSLYNSLTGSGNIAFGSQAGRFFATNSLLTNPSNSVFLGSQARASADNNTNEIVIGFGALGNGSNSVTLGNTSITKTILQGNVGIGTITPGAQLQVTSGAAATIGQIIKGATSQTADLLQIQDSSANKLMVVSSGGKLGIGVAAPATPLEVNGIVRADRTAVPAQYIQLDGGDGNNTALRAVAANKFLYIDNSDTSGTNLYNAIVFRNGTAGDTERMRVDANGNVGIGTTSPGSLLQVHKTDGSELAVTNTNAGSAKMFIGYDSTGGGGTRQGLEIYRTYGNSAVTLQINQANSNLLLQPSNGNVGIANTSPSYLLHVGSSTVTTGTSVAQFENAGGTCTITPSTAGGISCTSDERLKKDITKLDTTTTLDKLLGISTISYHMNNDTAGSPLKVGFSAQQLETILPDLVVTGADGYKSVSYAGLTPYLVAGMQAQQQTINSLKQDIQTLQAATGINSNQVTIANLNVSGPTTLTDLTVTGNLNITGNLTLAGTLTVKDLTLTNNLTIGGHIITAGNTPTITPQRSEEHTSELQSPK